MRFTLFCLVILIAVPAQAQSLEYEALQKQIAEDFGIVPKSMKITIEIEGDVQEGGLIKAVKPEVEIKTAESAKVGNAMTVGNANPVTTFSSPVRYYGAPVVRYYSAPAPTIRYYSAPAPTIRYYSAPAPRFFQQGTTTRTTSNLFGTRTCARCR